MVETAKIHRTTPRIVVVSSEYHYWTTIPQEIVDSPNPWKLLGTDEKYIAKCPKINLLMIKTALARTTEEGSRQLIWAAIGHEDKKDELRGAYISLAEVSEPSDFVLSEQGKIAQDKLWDNPIDELTEIEPRIQDIVKDYVKE
ncbi:hypothetical protein BJ912DRAFT_1097089 [Pholiota molesta]|nr:hypothetical protein BJ912DRAFT_1097089 [Pholiota molesta]